VKKIKKLAIKKITVRNLDEPKLDAVAAGSPRTVVPFCPPTIEGATCNLGNTCLKC